MSEPKKMGRPTKFNDSLRERIITLYEKGMTDEQVAQEVGVTRKSITNWKNKQPDFLPTLKEAKSIADDFVEATLFERACGYSHLEEKVFMYQGEIVTHLCVKHYPPDPTSMIFWLKNRRPDLWREKQVEDDQKDFNITVNIAKDESAL